MAEQVHSLEKWAEICEVKTYDESREKLRKLYLEGKKLCWSFDPENWDIIIWYRENDDQVDRYHDRVHSAGTQQSTCGHISKDEFLLRAKSDGYPLPTGAIKLAIKKYLS